MGAVGMNRRTLSAFVAGQGRRVGCPIQNGRERLAPAPGGFGAQVVQGRHAGHVCGGRAGDERVDGYAVPDGALLTAVSSTRFMVIPISRLAA